MCDDFRRDSRDFITDGVQTYEKGVGFCVVADVLPGLSLLKHGDEAFASMGFAYPHMTAEACCVLEALRLTRFARAGPQSSSQQEVGIGRDRLAMSWPNAMAEMCDDFRRDCSDFITEGVQTYRRGLDFVLLRVYCLG